MRSPEKTTELRPTEVLPDMTTNLSLGSVMAVTMDTAVTSDKFRPNMVTHFLIGCCFGLQRPDPVCQCGTEQFAETLQVNSLLCLK